MMMPTQEADEKFLRDIDRVFEKIELDDTRIAEIWATGYTEDGVTFFVMLDLVDGRTVLQCFTPGEPIKGPGQKPRPPTQYARLIPFNEAKPLNSKGGAGASKI